MLTGLTTAFGRMEGLELPNGVRRFAGIPFAHAERFAPPRPVGGWSGTRDATEFAPAAHQPVGAMPLIPDPGPGAALDEACLHATVWTPPGSGPWPVLVWVHGGSFLIGSSSCATYDAAALAARGVVVVSVNYRLGPFGFVDLSALGGADRGWVANAGLHDVVAALRWVRTHVAAFGGDQHRVTVFGESAGGGVILHLLGAPGRAELFDRAIVQSGSAGRTFEPATSALIAERFVAATGGSLDAVAHADPGMVIGAVGTVSSDPTVFATAGMMPFHPAIDNVLVDAAPDVAIARGAAQDCDLVLGVTRDEMHLFLESGHLDPDRAVRRVAKYTGTDDAAAAALLARYTERLRAEHLPADTIHAWGAIYSDREMVLPTRSLLEAAATHHHATYGYEFTWAAPPRPDGRPVGAAHAVDLPFTFSTFDIAGWREFVGADAERADAADELANAIQESWVRFATSSDPGWPVWSAGRTTYEFGETCGLLDDPIADRAALWESVG